MNVELADNRGDCIYEGDIVLVNLKTFRKYEKSMPFLEAKYVTEAQNGLNFPVAPKA